MHPAELRIYDQISTSLSKVKLNELGCMQNLTKHGEIMNKL